MTILSPASLLRAFKEFCQQLPVQLDDLEPLDDETKTDLREEMGTKGIAFEPIVQESAGGFVAFWQEPGVAPADRPVVWLDGDGSPLAVCAHSLAEFLTLLPYGTGLIRHVLEANTDHRQSPNTFRPAAELYPAEEVAERLAARATDAPGHPEYLQWLATTAGLRPAEDPVATISQAWVSHQNLEDWLYS